jgi:archaellum component FlaC
LRNEYGIPYPTPDEMVKFFKTEQKRKQKFEDEVNNLVLETRVNKLNDNSDRINDLHNYNEAIKIENKFPSAPTGSTQRRKEGGKKRSRKQRKQRRKKTRRSV